MEQSAMQDTDGKVFEALEALWMLLTATATVVDERERVRLTVTGMPSLVPCRVSGIALRHETGACWHLVLQQEGQQLPATDTAGMLPELAPLFAQAMGRGPVLIACPENAPQGCLIPPALTRRGVHCLAVVPLRTLHSQVGILLVGKRDAEPLSHVEEFVLRTLAAHSAIVIENVRLQHCLQQHATNLEGLVEERTAQLRRSEEHQRVLLEINNAIIANLDRPSLFRAITQALRNVLPFDRASLALYDPTRDVLTVSALAGAASLQRFLLVGTELPRRGSHLGWVLDQKRPLIRRDLRQERRSPEEDRLIQAGLRSYMAVPLLAKRRVIGTLNVGSRAPNQYAEEDAAFLLEVAQQVALAIENMMAYEEVAQLKARLEQESVYLQEEIKTQHNFEEIIGQGPAMRRVLQAIETVAPTGASVFILGETGTGKELIARAVHNLSPRQDRPLVKVNCAALPAGLIESELFGHEKGAFTGALSRRIGRFELAHGGTIFLDEIGDLPLELQAKLLRVLQEGECERVGGTITLRVDVRVIAATNRDLATAMQEGRFRQDLFYRLHVFPIQLPALREHREDIPLLVRHFVQRFGKQLGKRIETIPHKTMEALQAYPWPGNVRELEHIIERAVILSQGPQLELGDWLPKPGTTPHPSRIPTLAELERDHILEVLELTGWRVSGALGAAKILGLKRTTLESRMEKLGITRQG